MKKHLLVGILIVLNIAAIGAALIWFSSRTWPMVGHDYNLFLPYMIDSFLHQKINGLTIQWYTPSFAGGRPVFPFPEDFQFSLPQFLLWLVNPWVANMASICIYMAIGFIATYYFLTRCMGLRRPAGVLGAVFFIANGFYFNHLAVGHITFQAFPLFAAVMLILTHPRLPAWLGGLLLSFICAIILYSGIHNAFFFTLSTILTLPLLYLFKPAAVNAKRLLSLAAWGGGLTILLCGSKLLAVTSLMQIFPRVAQDEYSTNLWTGLVGMVHQLLGTMTMAPIYRLLGDPARFIPYLLKTTGTPYRIWEVDSSLSPALWLLLAGGALAVLFRKPTVNVRISRRRLAALVCLVLAAWLVIEFTLAKGIIYPFIRDLPLIRSFRVNVRYISAFLFPLAVTGAVIFDSWTRKWRSRWIKSLVFLAFNGIALGSLWLFHYIPPQSQVLNSDLRPILSTYQAIRYQGETFPVQNVIPNADPWAVFQENATSLRDPYNTFIKGIKTYREVLHAGSVYDVDNGYYNIINPTGYVFPQENGSSLFERISVQDQDKFLDFVSRRQPDWKLPVRQKVFNLVSFSTLLIELAALLVVAVRKVFHFPRLRSDRSKG